MDDNIDREIEEAILSGCKNLCDDCLAFNSDKCLTLAQVTYSGIKVLTCTVYEQR